MSSTTSSTGRVTAKDVARAAGVSQSTVSYVINDTPHQKISPATRARVLEAVERLGYIPSATARALRKGSSDVVLLVLPDVPLGPVVSGFIEKLTDDLDRVGLLLLSRRRRSDEAVPLWRDLHPAAVVALTGIEPRAEAEVRAAGIPVLNMALSPASDQTTAAVPQLVIGRLQVEHLAATGHRRIAYAAPDDQRVSQFLTLRLDGVRSACLDLGLDDPRSTPVPLAGPAARTVVEAWRAAGITAVAAYNDEVAFAVLAGMRLAGMTAPQDLAVIGVDNIPLAALAHPPLTTVDQNLDRSAAWMTKELVALVRGGRLPEPLRSESVTLVVRESA